jgi:2-polyprenyl-3-methyl-5-hydroxy-6-metoxy-1,4-benzoquinol methylase
MGKIQRAADFYSRTVGRYTKTRPHGIREPVLARQRDAIVELAHPRSTDSVLDVGCGAGRVAAVLRPRVARICGADASSEMLAVARRWLDEEIHAPLETLDLGRKFDLIVCCGVFDFLEDAPEGLRAIRRHLAPRGRAVVSAAAVSPIGVAYAIVRRAQGVRVRLYTSAGLRRLAASCGLRCTASRRLPGGSVAVILEPPEERV